MGEREEGRLGERWIAGKEKSERAIEKICRENKRDYCLRWARGVYVFRAGWGGGVDVM